MHKSYFVLLNNTFTSKHVALDMSTLLSVDSHFDFNAYIIYRRRSINFHMGKFGHREVDIQTNFPANVGLHSVLFQL